MATVTKPLALNESLNSTENTPRNIADVLADELDGIKQAINSQSGSGNGHIIQNSSGANMPSENTMQFVDAHLSDDSVGGKTKVETFKAVTEAEYSSETEDGAYIITDGDGAVIEPASEDYVEVIADGVKNFQTLLNELYALISNNKVTLDTKLVFKNSGLHEIYGIYAIYDSELRFSNANTDSSTAYINRIKVTSTSSSYYNNANHTVTNKSNEIPTSGTKITLYYGNKKATVDLQTTANRNLYNNTNSGLQAINTQQAIDEIAGNIKNPYYLPNNGVITDANDVTKTCISVIDCPTGSNVPSGINARCPIISLFGNTNIGWGVYEMGIQILITNSGQANHNYYRVKYSSSWYPWGLF